MPEYLSPGVYVEEVDAGPKPIEGVGTSTAGAVGVTARGPDEGKPVLVTSFADFQRKFGGEVVVDQAKKDDFGSNPEGGDFWNFPLSVRGFFDNGGQRLYVKRVVSKNAIASSVTLNNGVISMVRADAATNATVVQLDHLIHIDNGTALDVRIAGVSNPVTVTSYDAAARSVTIAPPLTKPLRAHRDYVVVDAPTVGGPKIKLVAYAKGTWGDGVKVRVGAMVAATLNLIGRQGEAEVRGSVAANGADPRTFTLTVSKGNATDLKAGDTITVDGAPHTVRTDTPAGAPATVWVGAIPWPKGTAVADGAGTALGLIDQDSTDAAKFALNPAVAVNLAAKDAIKVGAADYYVVKTAAVAAVGAVTPIEVEGKRLWKKADPVTDASALLPAGTTITENSADPAQLKVAFATAVGAAGIPAGTALSAGGTTFTIANPIPAATVGAFTIAVTVPPAAPAPNVWTAGKAVVRIRRAASTASPDLTVWGASALYPGAVIELDNATVKALRVVGAVTGNTVTLTSPAIALDEGHKVRLIEVSVRATYGTGDAAVDETFDGLRLVDDTADPKPDYLPRRLESSALIRFDPTGSAGPVLGISTLADFPRSDDATGEAGWAALGGGDDDLGSIDADAFIGEDKGPGKRTGILALEDIDEISICMVPGMWAPSIHSALITHCETLKDRFAIIDPPRATPDVEAIRTFREAIDTKYAAIYWPWIAVRDPFSRRSVELAPSAHVAGIYARVDVERGVHKAPANEVIRGIDLANGKHGLQLEITKREQDMLNPKGINALRFFPNRGTRVWGARCLTSDGSWKYINVRRLFIYVEESIDEGTQWVVFEPNDEPTWARVRQSVTNFLTTTWRSGALQGAKAEEAFFVRCDRSTMSQDDIDNGRLICVIGIAPVKPAEFVIFRISQKTLDAKGPT